MDTLSDRICSFLFSLPSTMELPGEVKLLNPYAEPEVRRVVNEFYSAHYSDLHERIFILGINPGRHGSGITGIAFTDPVRLAGVCGIPNLFALKPELSSAYIYEIIEAFGGAARFFSRFYINSVSPLGFTLNGKNMNYYDDKALYEGLKPFIIESILAQLELGLSRKTAICLGEGKNFDFLNRLNTEYKFFAEIKAVPHPRFVMQYKRKTKHQYIGAFADLLESASA